MTPTAFFQALRAWRHRPDDALLHLLFAALLIASGAMLVQDFGQLRKAQAALSSPVPGQEEAPGGAPLSPSRETGPQAPAADAALGAPMTFDLLSDGRLSATGTIAAGTAALFAAEVEKRGSYVKTVVLRSPGGSVQDALAMGRLIRAKGFATEVPAGAYCASSCPLVFAGGVERNAGRKAAIGVHQVYGATPPSGGAVPDGMAQAQRVSAECQRYLRDMGVDLEVWLRAMETPKEKLFYFTAEEMARLKLTTPASTPLANPAAANPAATVAPQRG
ncbi:hypothetical protein V5F77_04055 [Xanthobacter sp. DSM 24535]|uniref:COG3904 family protein n=1 Tax=Roseixanthobacter psychrophilus TaxID=3119917 RepID=UPI0037295AAE